MAIPFGMFTPQQMTKKRYRYRDRTSVHPDVVVAHARGTGPVTVYVPPVRDELPYTTTFDSLQAALAFAEEEAVRGHLSVSSTTDADEWWLANLIPE